MDEEQDELGGVDDAALDEAEAGLDEDDGFDQDLNDYSKVDRTKVDRETKELLSVTEPDLNAIEFEDLRSDQLAELGESRFADYLLWREAGGEPPGDTVEADDDVTPAIPDWGSETILPDKEWQKRLQAMYGTGHDQDGVREIVT